ncbi:hypothetical protein HK100_011963 [Physocladia obscura]|uniref:Protein kinase domain-containing protein n=1 Tax=Physocladia obscura TaxID=109957 RepID=A0AAD5T137_9FUNG|nr:hypothetical protein HK100_011963 [Physocladia obscura]
MDIWSAGCVLYEVISKQPLFPGSNELDQIHRIHNIMGTPSPKLLKQMLGNRANSPKFQFAAKEGTGIRALLPYVSQDCVDMVNALLIYNPDERISAKEALKHASEFVENNDSSSATTLVASSTYIKSQPQQNRTEPNEATASYTNKSGESISTDSSDTNDGQKSQHRPKAKEVEPLPHAHNKINDSEPNLHTEKEKKAAPPLTKIDPDNVNGHTIPTNETKHAKPPNENFIHEATKYASDHAQSKEILGIFVGPSGTQLHQTIHQQQHQSQAFHQKDGKHAQGISQSHQFQHNNQTEVLHNQFQQGNVVTSSTTGNSTKLQYMQPLAHPISSIDSTTTVTVQQQKQQQQQQQQ